MKFLLMAGLLTFAVCADTDNDIHGPGNVVVNGKDNQVNGAFNTLNGFRNKIRGKLNEIQGDSNDIQGNQNLIDGNGNLVIGSGNLVLGGNNYVKDSKSTPMNQVQPQVLKEQLNGVKQTFQKLAEDVQQKFLDKIEDKIAQKMKKRFQQRLLKSPLFTNQKHPQMRRLTTRK